jgi:hypothetical protein
MLQIVCIKEVGCGRGGSGVAGTSQLIRSPIVRSRIGFPLAFASRAIKYTLF